MDSVTKAHLYPMLEAKLDLIPGALQLYAGIDGGMERNSIRFLNPGESLHHLWITT